MLALFELLPPVQQLRLATEGLTAFSRQTRDIIWQRAGGKSELSGVKAEDGYTLECAHINHNRDYIKYDHPSNGRLLTVEEHLKDHILRHGHNGLPKHQNIWAIERIKERL